MSITMDTRSALDAIRVVGLAVVEDPTPTGERG